MATKILFVPFYREPFGPKNAVNQLAGGGPRGPSGKGDATLEGRDRQAEDDGHRRHVRLGEGLCR